MPDQKPTLEYGRPKPERQWRKIWMSIGIAILCLGIFVFAELIHVVVSINNFYARPVPATPATLPSTSPSSAPPR